MNRFTRSRTTLGVVVTALLVAGSGTPVEAVEAAGKYPAGCPWMDAHKTADQRAKLLLQHATLDQKLRWLDEQAANSPAQTSFSGVTYPVQVPCTPTVVYTDGPDYVRGSAGVTVFPAQLALAASWDDKLAYTKGKTQADEAFRSGKNVILAPGISSSRTPLAGRTPEYLGEDSLLSGNLAAAGINGLQLGNKNAPVMAVVKHYVANEQELDRQTSSSVIDGRTLREVYNQPFAIAVAKGAPGGIMCSYNQINGAYACENPILNNLLKGDTGFDGYVTSDFGAVHSTGPSLTNGLDQELNRPRFYTPATIAAALDAGQVSAAQIDGAAFRVVRAYIAAGLFDHPLPATPSTSASTPQNKAVAQSVAEQGSVLLKNDGATLPLSGKSKTVAVIGQTASNTPTNGVSAGTICAEGRDNSAACPNPVAPLDAITARAATAGTTVTYNNGADPAAAAATAASADVAVVFGYAKQGEFADRTTLALDGNGDALIAAVAAANPNTVVVLETGTATTMPWLANVKSVVEAWYPGDQQGTALARLLYGDTDFSGRLPMTFPKSLADIPTNTPAQYPGTFSDGSTTRPAGTSEIRQVKYTEGLKVGYKWYDAQGIEPLYPFGYGLSYTSFGYQNVRVAPPVKGTVSVSFDVRNTGSRAGTATPQLYLTLPAATGEPGKRLVGYAKVSLKPGQSTRVRLTIDAASPDHPLGFYNTATHAWDVAPGTYGVQAGASSRDLPLSGSFTVS
ncbi:glycoside hydrolase family 3 C-terminal domain-containing protein [Actinoplanes sp. TBRC 11911]|uniref:beta-glucosidase family protein n=1 Tax=Actinoplanes sp. TBRC 11911 TaxID=2729386 RepID=UPI00289C2DAC|nr:glycoside hydrolase family 3 C-terminal domain-containing protein [Actinoplanes sp. TBRC 11911]